MTYEERIVKLCKECPEREQCGYVPRKLMGDCTYLQDVMSGWELGQQDTLEEIEKVLAKDFRSPVNIIMSLRKLVIKLKEK